ncbi:MAG TPA: hypothetical protein PKA20_05225, partial [Burkholderiaceae bacterium]|nr:hypothetical protein [Burkholderiaceae bacterium]
RRQLAISPASHPPDAPLSASAGIRPVTARLPIDAPALLRLLGSLPAFSKEIASGAVPPPFQR